MERHNGVMIGGTCGAVARAGRLTVLVGDAEEPLGPDSPVPVEALRMADELTAAGAWDFETVAAALQAFVIEHDPPGVAALLEGDEETMVFLFDRAEAIEFDDHEDPLNSERVQRGVGRSGWTTELVSGPWVQLRLGLDPVVPWTSLRWGSTIGSSATLAVGEPIVDHADGYEPHLAQVIDTELPDGELPPEDDPEAVPPVREPAGHESSDHESPDHESSGHESLAEDVVVDELHVAESPGQGHVDEAPADQVDVYDLQTEGHPVDAAAIGQPPESHPVGSVEAAVAETAPFAAAGPREQPTDGHPTDEQPTDGRPTDRRRRARCDGDCRRPRSRAGPGTRWLGHGGP